jgi:hypothetical protein
MMDPLAFLKKLWITASSIGTIISIASLFDDLIAWAEFIKKTIVAYREIVDFIWTPLLSVLPFHLPRWTHDYLTISALTGVSILWALHNSAQRLGFPRMGSPLTVFRHVFLDFSIGGNTLELFRSDALEAARLQPEAGSEIHEAVGRIARPERAIFRGIAGCAAFAVLVIAAPFLIPVLMSHQDAADLRRAERLFQRRLAEIDALSIDPGLKAQWQASLTRRAGAHADFGAINALFYRTVRNNILAYYAAVAVIFAMIVLINYGINRAGEQAAAPTKS